MQQSFEEMKCQICAEKEVLYCCPRCSIRTCSLVCCKKHKGVNNNNCNGKRDRTKFITLGEFTDSEVKSDFHFLEDILNVSDRGKRLSRHIGVMKRNNILPKRMNLPNQEKNENDDEKFGELSSQIHPLHSLQVEMTEKVTYRLQEKDSDTPDTKRRCMEDSFTNERSNGLKRLINEAKNVHRNVNLLLMPTGMIKRKKNSTSYKAKSNTIFWSVEWKFHHILKCPKNSSETLVLKKSFFEESMSIMDRFSEKATLDQELLKHMRTFEKNIKKFHSFSLEDICLLMKKIPSRSNSPKYLKLRKGQTLQEALDGTTIIEYPTIEVVLNKNIGSFPLFVREIKAL